MNAVVDIYGGADPRDLPTYTVSEAASYVKVAPATLRSWVAGRSYPTRHGAKHFAPLIQAPRPDDPRLSFTNLIEAHVLKALRTRHSVSVKAVRSALDYAQGQMGVSRLLTSPELRTHAGELFLERYGKLVNLTRSGQLVMKKLLEAYLERVEWDNEIPIRLFPVPHVDHSDDSKIVVIDPFVSFGRPIISGKGVTTKAVAERIDAGESVVSIAADYQLTTHEVEEALIYELAA